MKLKTKLFEYQKNSTEKISSIFNKSGFALLEAGMGTGKTLMTISLIESLSLPFTVIVAPKTLLRNWQSEFERHVEGAPSILVWESTKCKTDKWQYAMRELLDQGGVFLVNTEAFQKDNETLLKLVAKIQKTGATMTVVDESSKIKDQGAHRTKAIAKAFTMSKYRLCLTGTMSANSPLDVYGQFLFLKTTFWAENGFRTWQIFRGHFAILVDQYGPNGVTFKKITGYRKVQYLRSLIDPYIVTVDKYEVLDLPEKVFTRVGVDLSSEEKKAYKDLKVMMMTILKSGEVIAVDQALSLYNKFRQITGGWVGPEIPISESVPSKLAALLDLVADSDEQIIVFANFTHEVVQITKALQDAGVPADRYDGSVSQDDRAAIVKRFNAKEIRAMVIQPKAGAYGLNLQANCNTIIYYSRPNSPEEFLQSQDRIHRIGQSKTCFYIDLVANGTIDEKVIAALEKKEDLSRSFSRMSAQEVEDL